MSIRNFLQYKQDVYRPRFIVKTYPGTTCGRIIKLKNVRQKGFEQFIKNEQEIIKDIKTINICDKEYIEDKSISRTKKTIRDLCLSNNFEYFATWTINEKNCDRFHLDVVVAEMKKLLKAFQRKYKNFKYLYIIEKHEERRLSFSWYD